MIAEWFDIRDATIYSWFDRLDAEPIRQAIRDRQQPGRPPKLGNDHRSDSRTAIRNPPTDAGYDELTWTTALGQRYLADEFDDQDSPITLTGC